METLLWGIAGGAGILFLWGLLWPRALWRIFVAWSHRDPGATEPSGLAYTGYRVLSGVGIFALVLSGTVAWQRHLDAQPEPAAPPDAIERMWGQPTPIVLNRVITASTTTPRDMVEVPVLGYQALDGERRKPVYPFALERWPDTDGEVPGGLVGEEARTGFVALDDARLMLYVHADPACIPRRVVVHEGGEIIRVGVFFTRPLLEDGKADPEATDCAARGSEASVAMIIPVRLGALLADRVVRDLAGGGIRKVVLLAD